MQVVEDGVGEFLLRAGMSVSSKRWIKRPLLFMANSQLNRAVRALPIWMRPVGDGAKRTVTVMGGAYRMLLLIDRRAPARRQT